MKKFLLFVMIAVVYVLHQDYWNWKNGDVVLGFLPVGLAYHAGYSILAAIMMAVLVKFAWPKDLESAGTAEKDKKPDQK